MDANAVRVLLALQDRGTGDLARQAGVARKTAWRWETGRTVAPETAERLMRALVEPAGAQAVPAQKTA